MDRIQEEQEQTPSRGASCIMHHFGRGCLFQKGLVGLCRLSHCTGGGALGPSSVSRSGWKNLVYHGSVVTAKAKTVEIKSSLESF